MDIKNWNHRYRTDQQKENDGVEVDLGEGFVIRVARLRNKNVQRKTREIMADPDYDAKRRAGLIDDAMLEALTIDVQATCILVGWRGLYDGDKELPYTVERAKELMLVPDFREKVLEIAGTQELYRQTTIEGAKDSLGKS